jgi:hypothetical protein
MSSKRDRIKSAKYTLFSNKLNACTIPVYRRGPPCVRRRAFPASAINLVCVILNVFSAVGFSVPTAVRMSAARLDAKGVCAFRLSSSTTCAMF